MADAKGKVAAMIVAKMKPKAMPVEETDVDEAAEGEGDDMGAEAAAEELISALSTGDAAGVVAAFKSLTELC